MGTSLKSILLLLEELGLLLESDPALPSVCTLITQQPLHRSWWSHPLASLIFSRLSELQDHPDAIATKLVSGKVTFVHRNLWSEIYAVGSERENWQMNTLSKSAQTLLSFTEQLGSVRTDQLKWPKAAKLKPGEAARELEKHLLVVSSQVHTESGAHAKLLETWEEWARRVEFSPKALTPSEAKEILKTQLNRLNERYLAAGTLPWK